MNAFIRQMAVLSVLWAFCEMLLPEGRQRRAVRLTVSLMMAASLLSSLSALLPTAAEPSRETFAFFQQGEGNKRQSGWRCNPPPGKRRRFWFVWPEERVMTRREKSGWIWTARFFRRR